MFPPSFSWHNGEATLRQSILLVRSLFALFPVIATDFFFFFFLINEHNEHPLSDTAFPREGISGVSWSGHSASRRRKSAKNLAFHPLPRVRCLAEMEEDFSILRDTHRDRLTISFSLGSSFGWRGVNTRISAICGIAIYWNLYTESNTILMRFPLKTSVGRGIITCVRFVVFFFLEFLGFFFSVEYKIFQFCKFDFL